MAEFNVEVATSQFVKRYREHQGKQINNSSLHAGSPMYYYCRHCAVGTDVLPESHFRKPTTVCEACVPLVEHGLVEDAKKRARSEVEAETPVPA